MRWGAWAAVTLTCCAVLWAQPPASPGVEHPELPDTKAETCEACHEGLAKGEVVHAPAGAGDCTTCHTFTGSGDATRVVFAEGASRDDVGALCAACHDVGSEAGAAAHPHAPTVAGGCNTCHNPHASERAALLTAAEPDLCVACHDDVKASLAGASSHAPAAKSCTICHSPHGSSQPRLLHADINPLCVACHAGPLPQAAAEPTLFGRQLPAPLASLVLASSRVQLDPLLRVNHPVSGHPVRGPKDPLVPGRAFTCVSCHLPHGSASPRLSRFATPDASMPCIECHK